MQGSLAPIVHQEILLTHLKTIFPQYISYTNVKKETNIKSPETGGYMEFDVWIPKLNLGFEFQDAYHYITTWYYQLDAKNAIKKDSLKRTLASQAGMNLISIPCWWDGSLKQLVGTINFSMPELCFDNDESFVSPIISLNPSFGFFSSSILPDVGELMLASFPSDSRFNHSVTKNQWWLGEKYDGMRFCWNPDLSILFSRSGNQLEFLPSMLPQLPTIFVDGELFFGRNQFNYIQNFFRASSDCEWQQLRLIGFDVPSFPFQKQPFEERYSFLVQNISFSHPFVVVAPRMLCEGREHLEKIISEIIENEGEGIVMRRKNSFYEHGRNSSLVKLKTSVGDMEAIVVGVQNNSVDLKLPNGRTFAVSAQDIHIPTPLTGDIVSFSFESNTRWGIPVGPKVYRVRTDLSWDDVVSNSKQEIKQLNKSSDLQGSYSKSPRNWNAKTIRIFLEHFAQQRGLNPFVADTWYQSQDILSQSKKGRKIMKKFKGGYKQVVQQVFPEIKFDSSAFKQPLWSEISTRRKFFENFAKKNNFDYKVPDNWYCLSNRDILSVKGSGGVISYHNYSLSQALIDLFPDISFDVNQLRLNKFMFHEASYRRKFFEEFAKEKKFDPFISENWYLWSEADILSFKGGLRVIWYHDNSIGQALIDLFPDIQFDKSIADHWKIDPEFRISLWSNPVNRTQFFYDYAEQYKFDPRIPENWYIQSRKQIMNFKGATSVINYHQGKISSALVDLFPEISFDKSKFQFYHYLWRKEQNRRQFFIDFAKQRNFDPLVADHWYNEVDSILATEESRSVISYHHHSVIRALKDLFPEMNFDKSKFLVLSWTDKAKRKQFFEDFAKEKGFDSHNTAFWHNLSRREFMEKKGASSVLLHHKNSLAKALLQLFPDIGLNKNILLFPPRKNIV